MEKAGNAKMICWMLALTIFADFLNGLVPNLQIGPLFRVGMLIVCFCAILLYSKRGTYYVGAIVAYLVLNSLLTVFKHQSVSGFVYDAKMAMKVCLYISIFCALSALYKQGKITGAMIQHVVFISMIYTPILFVASDLLGVARVSYTHGGVGSKSAFLSLNSINCALIVLYSVAMYRTFFVKPRLLWAAAATILMVPMVMLGTKTSILVAVMVPALCVFLQLKSPKQWIIALCSCAFLVGLFLLVADHIPGELGEIIRRQVHLFKQRDLITYLLSGRNWMLEVGWEYYTESSGFLEYLFGQGYYYSHQILAELTNYKTYDVRPIELDWADLILAYGPTALTFTYGHVAYVLGKTFKQYRNPNVAPYLVSVVLLTGFSATAGHVFTEAISSTFLALAASCAFIFTQEATNGVNRSVEMQKEFQRKEDLRALCTDDRFRFSNQQKLNIPILKRINADLLVKLVWMLLQSFGKKERVNVLFVDEVRNKSMQDNLHNTMDRCPHKFRVINLCTPKSAYPHTKLGYIRPAVYLVCAFAVHAVLYAALPFAGWEWVNRHSTAALIWIYEDYLKQFYGRKVKVYGMSDHHFYSTITCMNKKFESHVIQHGIIFGHSYYYPIYADHFLAWGERSREMQFNDPKVTVTGTYKFAHLKPIEREHKDKSILYCVSIVNTEAVKNKIIALMPVAKKLGYKLKVKMHPGSYFSTKELEASFAKDGLEFYKECNLSDIDFDVAIVENSTILIDLLFLEKPFVIYDGTSGYFNDYQDDLFWTNDPERLADIIASAARGEKSEAYRKILENELNSGKCTIWE